MEHTLNKSLFIILLNLTCFFLGKKLLFHTYIPGTIRIWIQRECTRIQQPIALSYTTVIEYSPMSNVVRKIKIIIIKKNILPFFLIYEIKSKILCGQAESQKIVHHDYTNVCRSARIYRWKETCRERSGGVEKRSYSLSHYIFPMSWNFLTKSEKYCASWLSAYHHGLQWEEWRNMGWSRTAWRNAWL